jgi:hypothetical protein
VARNLLIIQSKPAGRSSARSRHRKASHRRRDVTNGRCISANGVLFFGCCGLRSRWTCPCFSQSSLTTKKWVPHVPTLGHGIARTCGRSPFLQVCPALLPCTSVLHSCSPLLFCTFFDAFRRASTTVSSFPIRPPSPLPTRAFLASTEFLRFLMPSLCDSSFSGLL